MRFFPGSAYPLKALGLALVFGIFGCRSADVDKGYACLGLGDYALAMHFFGSTVERDPESYEARLGLGKAQLQKAVSESDSAAFGQALMQFEACRTLRPSLDLSALLAEAYTEKGRSLLGRKDTLAALASLAKAIERDSKNAQPLNLAGIIYGKLGEVGKAEALFRKALELDTADASAHFNLGMILWQAGEYREANGHWLRVLKTMPDDQDVLYWFALSEKKLRDSP